MAGRRWRIRLAEAAERDFVAIVLWTAEAFGRRQAVGYEETLVAALTALADGPDVTGSIARDEIQPGLRGLHAARLGRRARHLVLYRTAGARTIEILRILHDSMDLSRHVPPDTSGECS